ncbi:hypothetical protein BRADI_5g00891v3 [Brachypodium distachyon]|uniref:Amidase domain-containing protein n=1 Tax=Brachypodium distachyon TaxID=15368 RepID=A0A2K2CEP6_BRADI|nr:hypothetical protein BRADI_5g00891v3 [Brachypodium distachyon]
MVGWRPAGQRRWLGDDLWRRSSQGGRSREGGAGTVKILNVKDESNKHHGGEETKTHGANTSKKKDPRSKRSHRSRVSSMAWPRLQAVFAAALVSALLAADATTTANHGFFQIEEASIDAIRLGFGNGTLTSVALVSFYLDRIARLNPLLHAVIEVSPDALRQAARADAERRRRSGSGSKSIGLLHGVPVLLKDNIATRDALNTTAGSLALLGSVARRDAGVVARLRVAGAVVLGKANPSEWSAFRSVDDGWSARGGQTLNPYVLSAGPCGSSAGPGVAAAANLATVTLGSETDGSILCPSSSNSVVGIKPTLGLTSRAGVILTPRQDTIGPMCRTVSEAVQVLDAIVGYDALDAAATGAASRYIPHGGYTQFLKKDGLKGKRIGVPNGFFTREYYREKQRTVYKQHLDTMRKHGAVVMENLAVATNLNTLLDDIGSNEGVGGSRCRQRSR